MGKEINLLSNYPRANRDIKGRLEQKSENLIRSEGKFFKILIILKKKKNEKS